MGRVITWTAKQTEIANLLRKGKTRNELLGSGFKKSTVDRVRDAIKAELAEIKRGTTPPPAPPPPAPETKIKPRTLEEVQVGSFLVTPGDWRINQYGLFLILNTHDQAKRQFKYDGTPGEFICDAVQVIRKIMGLDLMEYEYFIKEGDNGAGTTEETNQGGGLHRDTSGEEGGESEAADNA